MCAGAWGGQKRVSDLLELEVQAIRSCHGWYKLKSGFLQEQRGLLTIELPLSYDILIPLNAITYFSTSQAKRLSVPKVGQSLSAMAVMFVFPSIKIPAAFQSPLLILPSAWRPSRTPAAITVSLLCTEICLTVAKRDASTCFLSPGLNAAFAWAVWVALKPLREVVGR